jgi:formylglycine-generating enzyme required for sulfatase activity
MKLLGDKQDLKVLRGQLQDREQKLAAEQEEAFTRAEGLIAEGKAKEALKLLVPYRETQLITNRKEILGKLERIVAAENELVAMVKEANADGVIDLQEIISLSQRAREYLKVNPKHDAINKLSDELLTRLASVPSESLATLSPEDLSQLQPMLDKLTQSAPVLVNSIGMKLRFVPAGRFQMGVGEESVTVTLTKPFFIGVYEVTQEEYERVMGTNPSYYKGASNPVEKISWIDATEFCRRLSASPEEKRAGRSYRLPTEAEWEYACRAGTTTRYSFGDDDSRLDQYAWFSTNSNYATHPVGEKTPNPWGIYDMLGNVWEWCFDWYGQYPQQEVTDPVGPNEGSLRVCRGGAWFSDFPQCQSAFRLGLGPMNGTYLNGFRVALSSPSGIPK